MATYVTRIIQVKRDNKWINLEWFAKEMAYSNEKKNLYTFDHYCDNAINFRQVLQDSSLSNRGFPRDINLEPEVIKQLKSETNWGEETICSKVIPGYHRHCYNMTYFTLAELQQLSENLNNKWFANYKESIQHLFHNLQTDALYRKFILNEDYKVPEYDESSDDIQYLEEEEFFDFLSVHNECVVIEHLVNEIYGYISDNDIRILIYFE